jgi:uncharacterized protein
VFLFNYFHIFHLLMSKKENIDSFLKAGTIAVAGVSSNEKKFGSIVFKDLKKKGYNVVPVNPNLTEITGVRCYSSVNDIPGEVEALVTIVPPEKTLTIVNNINRTDIKYVWMQSGSESNEAADICERSGINVISGECILMFAQPEGFHKFHRFISRIFGKLPV